jgi:hypothetical protein
MTGQVKQASRHYNIEKMVTQWLIQHFEDASKSACTCEMKPSRITFAMTLQELLKPNTYISKQTLDHIYSQTQQMKWISVKSST